MGATIQAESISALHAVFYAAYNRCLCGVLYCFVHAWSDNCKVHTLALRHVSFRNVRFFAVQLYVRLVFVIVSYCETLKQLSIIPNALQRIERLYIKQRFVLSVTVIVKINRNIYPMMLIPSATVKGSILSTSYHRVFISSSTFDK